MAVFSIRWRRVAATFVLAFACGATAFAQERRVLRAARSRHRSRHRGRARHGGGAGKARRASRRRHPAAGRQCGRCRGRHRLCAGRHLSARRQHRRRRLHGDSFGRAQRRRRHRLSRDRAGRDHARYFSGRRTASPIPTSRAIPRSASACPARSPGWRWRWRNTAPASFTLAQILQARDRAGARRLCRRRRHGRHAAGHVSADGALAEFGEDVLPQPTARRCRKATGWSRPISRQRCRRSPNRDRADSMKGRSPKSWQRPSATPAAS